MSSGRKPRVVIYGAGGHALVVADIVRATDRYEIAGFLVDSHFDSTTRTALRPHVLGGSERLECLATQGINMALVAVGECGARMRLSAMLQSRGFTLISVCHPSSAISRSSEIGAGTVIAAGVTINAEAVIGSNVIVNTAASIDHECQIADGAHIAPGVRLAGRVIVGSGTLVGIGSTVIECTRIGAHTIIGAGSVVVSDIPDDVVAYGVPARIMRKNDSNRG